MEIIYRKKTSDGIDFVIATEGGGYNEERYSMAFYNDGKEYAYDFRVGPKEENAVFSFASMPSHVSAENLYIEDIKQFLTVIETLSNFELTWVMQFCLEFELNDVRVSLNNSLVQELAQ